MSSGINIWDIDDGFVLIANSKLLYPDKREKLAVWKDVSFNDHGTKYTG